MSYEPAWVPLLRMMQLSFQRFLPYPLPFVPSLSDIREWQIDVDSDTAASCSLSNGNYSASLHRILVEAGFACTSATSIWDPRCWFALFRYGGIFSGTEPFLLLTPGCQLMDPRLKQVLAEEIGAGITCYILREHFGINHIADVYPLLQKKEMSWTRADDKRRPDFLCLDRNNRAIIAESKGAAGNAASLLWQVENKGRAQVNAVDSLKYRLRDRCNRIVVGTNLTSAHKGASKPTITYIRDPIAFSSETQNDDSDFAIRIAYGKILRFAGQDMLAESLIGHFSPPPLDIFPFVYQGAVLRLLGFSAFGGVICMHERVLGALINASVTPLNRSLPSILADLREFPGTFEGGYSLSNGVVIINIDLGAQAVA